MHSQFGIFCHPSSSKACSNCLTHSNPAEGCPYRFRSRSATGSSTVTHDLGHLCRGSRIQTSGHSDFQILSNVGASSNFTWVSADTASAAGPPQPDNLAITSMIFAAVICDADEPCSVKTALAPEPSFAMSPLSTTLPLYFCNLGSFSACCEVTYVHQCCKVDFLFVSLSFQNNLLCALDFSQIPYWNCLELFPFLVHGSLCIRNVHRMRWKNKIVYQIVMCHRVVSFACDVVFVSLRQEWFHSLQYGFMSLHCTSVLRIWNLVGCFKHRSNYLRVARTFRSLFGRHCSVHMHFQLFLAFV